MLQVPLLLLWSHSHMKRCIQGVYSKRCVTICCVLTLCVVRKRSTTWSTIQSCAFLTPEWVVHVPQVANGFSASAITGIWVPMEAEKKVCQRLADQVSSLRWDLICPSQLMGLKKRIRLGSSSTWDSRPVISVRSTESSTVATMRCCGCRLNCSARREPANMSLRSWKGYQWLSICWVTLSCEGMAVTSALETDLSSRTNEDSIRRLSTPSFPKTKNVLRILLPSRTSVFTSRDPVFSA
jgi:hypothetical protein